MLTSSSNHSHSPHSVGARYRGRLPLRAEGFTAVGIAIAGCDINRGFYKLMFSLRMIRIS